MPWTRWSARASGSSSEPASRSRSSMSSRRGRQPPEGSSDEDYRWHSYRVYPSGRPDAVEFIDVYKSFGRSRVLRGLNMGLPEGMVSMILGPSGTGKSVCIKHMVGLLYPDQGDVLVHGGSVPSMPDDDLFEHAQEVRAAVPGRRAVRLDGPVRQRRLPAAPAHREGRGRGRGHRHAAPERGRPGRRAREDAQRALGRDAQARRVRAGAGARARTSCCSTSPTRGSIRSGRRCWAS